MGKQQQKTKNESGFMAKIFSRGAQEFRHDLYKSDVKKFMRNTSFKRGIITIVEIEHAHIFHSHNSQGKVQEYTSTVGNHFHKVTTSIDEDGNLIAECGPALRQISKKKPSGSKRVIEPVKWMDYDGDGPEDGTVILDTHTHSFEYQGSETLSGTKVAAIQSRTQAAIAAAAPKPLVSSEKQEQNDDSNIGDIDND